MTPSPPGASLTASTSPCQPETGRCQPQALTACPAWHRLAPAPGARPGRAGRFYHNRGPRRERQCVPPGGLSPPRRGIMRGEGPNMRLDLEKVRANARAASTEDLLDRVTVFRDGLEPEAVAVLEEEL